MTITIANVPPRQIGDALRLIFPDYADHQSVSNKLNSSADKHRLIGAFSADSELVAAALIRIDVGNIASLVGPGYKTEFADTSRAIVREVDAYAKKIGIRIIQSTFPFDQTDRLKFWESENYRQVAKIEGRVKAVSSVDLDEEKSVGEFLFEEVGAVDEARFERIVHSTFEESKDLPYFQQNCSSSEAFAAMKEHAGLNSKGLVVTHRRNDIGCVLLSHEKDQAEIHYFGVKPSSRGMGAGKRILQFSERWAREKNASIITAYVDSENCVAKHVYDACEFTIFSQQIIVAKELA